MVDNNIDINNVIVHAPYIINLANDGDNYNFAISFLKQELKRTEELGLDKLVLHPGSHVSLGLEKGLNNIINALNLIITEDTKVKICLETMAGKGSECGSHFEELKTIIDHVNYPDKIMVCLDTCHINDAGYDITHFDELLAEFDQIIGINRIACIHINDSKNNHASHKDRHANIGYGTLGFDNLIKIIYHPSLKEVPKILETPYILSPENDNISYPPYKQEIMMIKDKQFNPHLVEDILTYYK
jgi:deoxyribonuclease-4